VGHFLGEEKFAVAQDAMSALQSFDWPGNIRELKMTIAGLKAMSPGKILTAECVRKVLGPRGAANPGLEILPPYRQFKERVLGASEKGYFESLLQCSHGNIAKAARHAGIDRKNFYEKMKQLGIKS
jgi:two-component system nitrogen regulation response regulator NtrX